MENHKSINRDFSLFMDTHRKENKMNKTKLRKIIKEEMQKYLTEEDKDWMQKAFSKKTFLYLKWQTLCVPVEKKKEWRGLLLMPTLINTEALKTLAWRRRNNEQSPTS